MRIQVGLLILLPLLAYARPPDGGGAWQPPRDELSDAQRAKIDAELQRNVAQLRVAGKLAPVPPLLAPLQGGLQWPLRAVSGFTDPAFHGISNFVDLDPTYPNHVLDWNCGARTYDIDNGNGTGYNHAGIDIFTWPFSWLLMDQQKVDIVAAAAGTIIGKVDGNDDRSCPNNYSPDWNAVYVRHADGTVAWYGHMKKNSLTSKAIGASVSVGEFLGKVGSAGFSSGPHLHFENHSGVSNYTILEPFQGACQSNASLWAQQKAYRDSAINKVATHSAPPVFPDPNCPNPVDETPNFADQFQPNQNVYFVTYYRDQQSGQITNYSVLRPNGSVFASWNGTASQTYDAAYWYWWYTLPANAPFGLWRFRATFQGVTYEHRFTVGDVIFADPFE
jgi:murein DD-endopeptidase MepM/ murein hydrolase activator NlpD